MDLLLSMLYPGTRYDRLFAPVSPPTNHARENRLLTTTTITTTTLAAIAAHACLGCSVVYSTPELTELDIRETVAGGTHVVVHVALMHGGWVRSLGRADIGSRA